MQPRANIDRLAGKRITEVDDYRSADALLVEARCLLGSAVPDGGAVIVGRPRDMTIAQSDVAQRTSGNRVLERSSRDEGFTSIPR